MRVRNSALLNHMNGSQSAVQAAAAATAVAYAAAAAAAILFSDY